MAAPLVNMALLPKVTFLSRNLKSLGICCHNASRTLSTSSHLFEKWHLLSAVCLERFPSITMQKRDMETKFENLLGTIEHENSVLSDHELRHQEDLKIAERRKRDDYEETEADAIRQTAVEIEDEWEAEFSEFKVASRTTEADEKNDLKSLNRKLDRKLTLLVKQKFGNDSHWVLPQGLRNEGEDMREAAERVLQDHFGDSVQSKIMGNAPVGFYKYKYPEKARTGGVVGAKVFFFKAQLEGGEVKQESKDVIDHAWVTKHELHDYPTSNYLKSVNKFILEL